jgi:beta-galactosidase
VSGGGTVVVWYASGIVDADHQVWPGGYPGALREVLGVRVEEFRPLPPGEEVRLSTGDVGSVWTEYLHAEGAAVEATYPHGTPAVTRHRYGEGTAWYVSTRLDEAGLARFLGTVLSSVDIEYGAPAGVEVVRRRGDHASWVFVVNHTDRPCPVPANGVDLVTGDVIEELPAGGYAVIRE